MPRLGSLFSLVGANAHTQLTSTGTGNVQTLVLEKDCNMLELSAQTNPAIVTFDNSTPTTVNGMNIPATTQPTTIPLGYMAHSAHTLKVISSVAGNSVLNVMQMS